MKVLTVRDPWATAIAYYGKTPENRSWRTHHRGPLGIHCGLGFDPAGARDPEVIRHRLDALETVGWKILGDRPQAETDYAKVGLPPEHFAARGLLLGVAQLNDVHHADDCWDPAGLCTPWAMGGMFHWEISDFRPLPEPIAARGAQSLWVPEPEHAAALTALLDTPAPC